MSAEHWTQEELNEVARRARARMRRFGLAHDEVPMSAEALIRSLRELESLEREWRDAGCDPEATAQARVICQLHAGRLQSVLVVLRAAVLDHPAMSAEATTGDEANEMTEANIASLKALKPQVAPATVCPHCQLPAVLPESCPPEIQAVLNEQIARDGALYEAGYEAARAAVSPPLQAAVEALEAHLVQGMKPARTPDSPRIWKARLEELKDAVMMQARELAASAPSRREPDPRCPLCETDGLANYTEGDGSLRLCCSHCQSDLVAASRREPETERLSWFVREVIRVFSESEAQGYRSRDRQYALEMLQKGLEVASRREPADLPAFSEVQLELAAAWKHATWARWTLHLLKSYNPDNVARWQRQIDTPYADLSDEDKEKDRREVRALFALLLPRLR